MAFKQKIFTSILKKIKRKLSHFNITGRTLQIEKGPNVKTYINKLV